MGLLTTTVGSFPKPRELRRARRQYRDDEIDVAELRLEERNAVQCWIALQERLGFCSLTDGEMTRDDLVGHYRFGGVEQGGLVRCWGNHYIRPPRVTGPIERGDSVLVEAWTNAQKLTTLPVRATVTGPYTLMHWSFDEHYASREACARAYGEAVGAEIRALVAAGATDIQFDEPALPALRDDVGWAAEVIEEVAARRGDARLWMRVGFGNPEPDWGFLAALPADRLMIGLAHLGLTRAAGLRELPPRMTLVAGVIDGVDPEVETTDRIRGRIDDVLGLIPAERLIVSADVGLGGLSPTVADAKISRLVEAAAAFA